jgi:hypothetical protein
MLLKKGSSGQLVKLIQEFLEIPIDGAFGPKTEAAVKAWQYANNLDADGIVGPKTWDEMGIATTDISEKMNAVDLEIDQHMLPKGEYKPGPTRKEYIFLHHTAGWHNPYNTIDAWARDKRGAIATEFVLGGQSVKGNDIKYDGTLVQCMPEGAYGWHLGGNGSQHMHTHSVAIEVCNFGSIKDGKTWAGVTAEMSQVVKLPNPFRGSQYWHRYSDKQIAMLKKWILYVAERDEIDPRKGLVEQVRKHGAKGFEFNEDAYYGRIKGMWTHTNTRKDKVDMFPQPELLDMLMEI